MHGQHEGHREYQQNDNAEQGGQLFGQKIPGCVDIRSAALNDVAGAVMHMPGEGKVLDMGKEPVPHSFDQCFGSFGVIYPEGVLADYLTHGDCNDGKRHDPKIFSKISKAAETFY